MSPDQELDHAEAEALAATLATAEALCSLLVLVRPFVERRGREDAQFAGLAKHLHVAVLPFEGTPTAIRDALTDLRGEP